MAETDKEIFWKWKWRIGKPRTISLPLFPEVHKIIVVEVVIILTAMKQ